jgi:hypothetical protein
VLAVERLRLLVDLLAVALVLALHLLHQGLHALHLLLRANLSHEEGRERRPDDDREEDDRDREVDERQLVQEDQQVEEGKEEDIPGRVEMLDPQEALGDDRGQRLASRFSLIGPGRTRRDGTDCIGRCASRPSTSP